MNIKTIPSKNGGKLVMVKSYKKPGASMPSKKVVETFGYLDDLKKEYDDPIAHFREYAKMRTLEEKEKRSISPIKVDLDEHIDFERSDIENSVVSDFIYTGQMPLLKMYNFLELDSFLVRKKRSWGIRSGMEVILKLLTIGRIIVPGSKYSTWERLRNFRFGYNKPTDDDVYNALEFLGNSSEEMITHINTVIDSKINRDKSLMYYDVTNYYCELDDPDNEIDGGLRKRGVSKEHRPEPIIQMGLFMDTSGLPVTYGLFPGNNNDVTTFAPMIDRTRFNYGMKNMIYVADKGMMSHDNIAHILLGRNGYIISDSPRKKQDASLMAFLKDQNGYTTMESGEFKYKSRTVPMQRSVTYKGDDGKKTCTIQYNEIQIVFWSKKYAERAKKAREEALLKEQEHPHVFDNFQMKALFDKTPVDASSGEKVENLEYSVTLNEEKLKAVEEVDGYYILRTNVIGKEEGEKEWQGESRFRNDNLFQLNREVSDFDIIKMYRGLWEIEETFKITKSFLKTRPVYVRKESSIKAHFLTCFIALVMFRLLEKAIFEELNGFELIEALREARLCEVDNGVYKNTNTSKAMKLIGDKIGMDLTKVWYTKEELKKLQGTTKA